MMRLLRSWRDSLLLLAPQNFKLFALVTLKSTFETYKVLARTIWSFWLLPIIIVAQRWYLGKEAFEAQFTTILSMPVHIMTGILYIGCAVWMTVVFCLATRPSIGKKTVQYFYQHGWFMVMLALVSIMVWLFNFWAYQVFASYQFVLTAAAVLVQALDVLIVADFIPLWIFLILFFLDSDGSIKQLWYAVLRAVKMLVYNVPLLIILGIIIALPNLMFARYMNANWSVYVAPLLYLFLLKPLIINIWTNIYIKKFHEMPELYFKQPK